MVTSGGLFYRYWFIPLVQPPTVLVFIDHVEKLSIRRLELQTALTTLPPRRPTRMPLVHERRGIGRVVAEGSKS